VDEKVTQTLELDKILERLAEYASFSGSAERLRALRPTHDLESARFLQQKTTEARRLLELHPDITMGGTRDVRPLVERARRLFVLQPGDFIEVKATLEAGARLRRTLERLTEHIPLLADLAGNIWEGKTVVTAIEQVIDDNTAQVRDSASSQLAKIRRDLNVQHGRLRTRLQNLVGSSKVTPYLQEAIITMRGGRYVLPVKSEHKGRVQGIIHDQSSSGATLFIEPMEIVEINNQLRELELAEEEEVHRILTELTDLVGQHADEMIWTVDALAELDAALACARYADAIDANPPALVDFRETATKHPGSTVMLHGARHPLLDPATVVPIDAELDDETYVLIITGPNTGGKTVALKTVGLLALMAQCGLHIPAGERSSLSVFSGIYADIGDEQSIEQSLSTFSAHMTNLIAILEQADERSLVVLDELCAGTDPAEGAALARAVLSYFLDIGATTLVATHYPEMKLYGHNTPGVRNASVEFNTETLAPTYRLMIGLPGRSNAIAIAQRLGLREDILAEARSYVGQNDLQADDLLDDIHRLREEARQHEHQLAQARAEADSMRDELGARLAAIEDERRQILEEARSTAQTELEALRMEIRVLSRKMQVPEPPPRKKMEAAAKAIEERLTEAIEPAYEPPAEGPIEPGDRVYVRRLRTEGEIISIDGEEAEVLVGQLHVRLNLNELERRGGGRLPIGGEPAPIHRPVAESPGMELHLRGMTIEEALPELDDYLDSAYLAGLPWVRIVHGKGTGVLRRAVRERLKEHPLVKKYEKAEQNEGGDGVTIVHLAPLE
jgi:DNA mismatch repair protein MutS2